MPHRQRIHAIRDLGHERKHITHTAISEKLLRIDQLRGRHTGLGGAFRNTRFGLRDAFFGQIQVKLVPLVPALDIDPSTM